jgi:hypothetical protein
MGKRIRSDVDWYELRGLPIREARKPRDCDMAEHKVGWEGAIQAGDEYVWLPHAHLSVCSQHYSPEDVVNGPVHPDSPSDGPRDEP